MLLFNSIVNLKWDLCPANRSGNKDISYHLHDSTLFYFLSINTNYLKKYLIQYAMKRHSSEMLGCTLTFIADKAKLIRIAWNFYTSIKYFIRWQNIITYLLTCFDKTRGYFLITQNPHIQQKYVISNRK